MDDVATYAAGLGDGTDLASIVGPLAPPFDRLFLKVQGVRPDERATDPPYAWGVLVDALFADETETELRPQEHGARWVLVLSIVVEWDKGEPVGPLITYRLPVAPDGTWLRRPDGAPELGAAFPGDSPPAGTREFVGAESGFKLFLVAPLLGISFMHAKNVDLRLTEPPSPSRPVLAEAPPRTPVVALLRA